MSAKLKVMDDADSELKSKMIEFTALLRWFHEHGVKIHLRPTKDGWKLRFTIPE